MQSPILEEHDGIVVVRDDFLPGGTKQRALMALKDIKAKDVVYAGPVQGYAQIALAYACHVLGKQAHVFVAARKELHPRTALAQFAGAILHGVRPGYLACVQAEARRYCERTGAYFLPFGLDEWQFMQPICNAAHALPVKPKQVWTVAGSGMLTRALQLAWPQADFIAVQIGKQPNVGRARLIVAPERYEQNAQEPPPFQSCSNYDAKAWQFIKREAKRGALFWNVAS